ncbi:hypothetical protein AWC11_03360 [Mycobacterium interjectum]|nr:hypothetical protein AWC11_03360 [Mycobacterium interjectum]
MLTKRANAAIVGDDSGEFDMILSNGALDRDGERLLPEKWKQPLPERISINVNHSKDVSDIVGSGEPFIDDEGNLRVRGTFASTPAAQHIRQLVAEGHLSHVSVEFLRHRGGENELVAGAFVNVPSNPTARVLTAKAAKAAFEEQLDGILLADDTLVQAIHDACCHLGAQCVIPAVDPDPGDDDGANKAMALLLRTRAIRN